jgi:hypothetical protein
VALFHAATILRGKADDRSASSDLVRKIEDPVSLDRSDLLQKSTRGLDPVPINKPKSSLVRLAKQQRLPFPPEHVYTKQGAQPAKLGGEKDFL